MALSETTQPLSHRLHRVTLWMKKKHQPKQKKRSRERNQAQKNLPPSKKIQESARPEKKLALLMVVATGELALVAAVGSWVAWSSSIW